MTLASDEATDLSRMFKALSDPTRIRILEFLCERCGAVALGEKGDVHPIQGPSFGEVCCHITGAEKITTTISFHLNILREAGLITVEKRGRFMVCDVRREALESLSSYLMDKASCERSCRDECR